MLSSGGVGGGGAAAPPMMLEEVMIQIGAQCKLCFKGEGVMIQRLRADVRSDDSSRGAAKSGCQMYQVAGGLGGAAAPP